MCSWSRRCFPLSKLEHPGSARHKCGARRVGVNSTSYAPMGGRVYPSPYPLPGPWIPRIQDRRGFFFRFFCHLAVLHFFIVFSIPFLMPLGSIFPANLLPQIHQNPSKIDAKMPSHVDFVFLSFFDGFLLPTSTPGTSRIKPPLQREHDLSKNRFSQFVSIFL